VGRKRTFGVAHQSVTLARGHQAPGFDKLVGICWPCLGANRTGSEYHSNDAWVLLFSLVAAHRRPTGAVSNQEHLFESSLSSEVDPGGEAAPFLPGHTPIPTAANPLFPSPRGHVPKVVHARIANDACVAAFRQGPPNHRVRWIVKVGSPAVYPYDCDRLGYILRWGKDRAAVDDVIVRANIDQFFGELAR